MDDYVIRKKREGDAERQRRYRLKHPDKVIENRKKYKKKKVPRQEAE